MLRSLLLFAFACLYMYVDVCVYVYVCIYVCTYTYVYEYICAFIYIHTYIHTYIHICIHICIYVCACTYIQYEYSHTHIYTYVCIYTCIHIPMHKYMCKSHSDMYTRMDSAKCLCAVLICIHTWVYTHMSSAWNIKTWKNMTQKCTKLG
jgi:hypothetical protein